MSKIFKSLFVAATFAAATGTALAGGPYDGAYQCYFKATGAMQGANAYMVFISEATGTAGFAPLSIQDSTNGNPSGYFNKPFIAAGSVPITIPTGTDYLTFGTNAQGLMTIAGYAEGSLNGSTFTIPEPLSPDTLTFGTNAQNQLTLTGALPQMSVSCTQIF